MENKRKFIILAGLLISVAAGTAVYMKVPIARADFISNTTDALKSIPKRIEDGLNILLNKTDIQSNASPGTGQAINDKTSFASEQTSLYQPALSYEDAVVTAVDKAAPSVVSIVISKDVPIIENCPINIFPGTGDINEDGSPLNGIQFYAPCPSSGKTEMKKIGAGSGFVASNDGLIITNNHVVSDKAAIYTIFSNTGKKYSAKVLATAAARYIAILKIDSSDLKPLTLGNSDSVRLGQTAIAIGNALGEFQNTVSVGVISGKERNVTASDNGQQIQDMFQTDAAINPGNSGGPLLNLRGEVIALNTAIVSGAQNIGFAIPINRARTALSSFQKNGKITEAYLGVWYEPADNGLKIGGNKNGSSVLKDSPAEKAGLKEGDIITEAGGKPLDAGLDLAAIIAEYTPGETLPMKIIRAGKEMDINAVLGEKK
jgi:serine protease Do